ncbi:MAG TPA: histidine phosphatase family protein [Chthonomonadaceae bacterium]|nr:histidine phosphatase family protein [Chthonomonadaceae bacterium]
MTDSTLRLYLVRHGITAWNRALRLQGHSDILLDSEGEEQARRIAARMAAMTRPPQAIYSSDLTRARYTAEAIAAPLGLTVQTTPLLRELMLGDWEGLTREEIEARGDAEHLERYRLHPHQHVPPGAETVEEAWGRMLAFLDLIHQSHTHGEVAIVGHGGSLRLLLMEALAAPMVTFRHILLGNTGLSIIEESGPPEARIRRVMLLNDTSHLL